MVSQKIIKGLDFQTIEDYFVYVVESNVNGNNSQVKELIDSMSKQQKADFIKFCDYQIESADGYWLQSLKITKSLTLKRL